MRTKRGTDLRVLRRHHSELGKERIMRYFLDNFRPESNNASLAKFLTTTYGSLTNIFAMGAEELYTIPFIDEDMQDWIMTSRVVYKRLKMQDEEHNHLFHPELVLKEAPQLFNNTHYENFYVYYIDDNGDIIKTYHATSNSTFRVYVTARELVDDLRRVRPEGIIMIHNHPSGSNNPSTADIDFTNYMCVVCETEGIKVLDHFIFVKEDDVYSFKNAGRLEQEAVDGNYRDLFKLAEKLFDDKF